MTALEAEQLFLVAHDEAVYAFGVAAMDAPTAFYVDAFGLVLPFFLVSLYVLKHQRLTPRPVAVPVIVIILGLYALSAYNLWSVCTGIFGKS